MKALLIVAFANVALATAPVLFYSDITSGPITGGENGNGSHVCLYGRNLGSSQGASTVTLNGVSVAAVNLWSSGVAAGDRADDKVCVQPGAATSTGNFVITTAGGTSNGLPFTVRSGTIYYVKTTGNDSNAGTFASPWLTIPKARNTIAAGDIAYIGNGVNQTVDDGSGWNTCLLLTANSGTSGNPKAIVAYPGAASTIGSNTACGTAVRSNGAGENYWVFAGFTMLGIDITIGTYNAHDWRIVGNDLSCPNGNSQSGCLDTGGDGSSHDFAIFGNNIHNAGTNNSPGAVTALYHGYYMSEQNHNMNVGWNTFRNVYGGRCIQIHVNVGPGSYSLDVHDNVIHDCQLDGIILSIMDPSLGPINIYNNVVYNAGAGPANLEGSGAWNCFNIQGWSNTGVTGESGTASLYNNTMYNCGSFVAVPYDRSSGGVLWTDGNTTTKGLVMSNNIMQLVSGPADYRYVNSESAATARVTGAHNVFYGLGGSGVPTNTSLASSVYSDPLFTAPASAIFTIPSNSPAVGIGSSACSASDFFGASRGSPCDAGAIQFAASGSGGSASGGTSTSGGSTVRN